MKLETETKKIEDFNQRMIKEAGMVFVQSLSLKEEIDFLDKYKKAVHKAINESIGSNPDIKDELEALRTKIKADHQWRMLYSEIGNQNGSGYYLGD